MVVVNNSTDDTNTFKYMLAVFNIGGFLEREEDEQELLL